MHTLYTITSSAGSEESASSAPIVLGRWLLMLGVLLMTWGLVPQV